METNFKNIVGTIPLSELFEFKLDDALIPETARYFIIKSALRTKIDEKTGEEIQEYISYVYSTGVRKDNDEMIDSCRCLDLWNNWRYSFNDRDFLKREMIEIDMNH